MNRVFFSTGAFFFVVDVVFFQIAVCYYRGLLFFLLIFWVKITHFESFAVCNFRGLDANRENRENKAPAEKTRSTVVSKLVNSQ